MKVKKIYLSMYKHLVEEKKEQPIELHTKHCMDNEIAECTCSIRLKDRWVREEAL